MTESAFKRTDALQAHLSALYQDGKYAEALETATREAKYFTGSANFLRYFRASMAARLNRADEALKLLEEMLADGYWLSERTWGGEDFDPIRELPAFKRLRERSREYLRAAQAEARPECLTILPMDDARKGKLPLLMALHGNFSSVRWHKAHWRAATGGGWLVAMPQSSQVFGLDSEGGRSYVWNDEDRTRQEVLDAYAALSRGYAVASDRFVLGGFSRGAEVAIQLAVSGAMPVQGFIAVCPGGPLTMKPELWEPVIAQGKGRDLRAHVIVGAQDQFAAGGERIAELLRGVGIPCEFESHPDMGHDYPADFGKRLSNLLDSVLDT